MRNKFIWKLMAAGFFVFTTAFCVFVSAKRVFAYNKLDAYKKERKVNAEMPWESMAHQFIGAVLFK